MNTAEMLRKEIANAFSFTEGDFVKFICNGIKSYGYSSLICDHHITHNNIKYSCPCLERKYEQTATEIARKHGFRVYTKRNGYGVKSLCFSL